MKTDKTIMESCLGDLTHDELKRLADISGLNKSLREMKIQKRNRKFWRLWAWQLVKSIKNKMEKYKNVKSKKS